MEMLILAFPFFFVLLHIPQLIAYHSYLILIASIVSTFIFLNERAKIRLNLLDVSLIFFVSCGYLSIYWSNNLMYALQEASIYSVLLLLYFYAKGFVTQDYFNSEFCYRKISLIACAYVLYVLITYMCITLDQDFQFEKLVGVNHNYFAALMLSFIPFLLFFDLGGGYRKALLLSIVSINAYIVLVESVRGVFLIGLVLVFLWFKKYFRRAISAWTITGCVILSIVLIHFSDDVLDIGMVSEVGKRMEFSRFNNQILSLQMLPSNLFLGAGVGQWIIDVYNYDLTSFSNNLYYNHLLVQPNHNYYGLKLGEHGIFSILLFGPYLAIVYRSLKNFRQLNYLAKSCSVALLVYLLLAIFYRSAGTYYVFFSRIHLIGVMSAGVLSRELFADSCRYRFHQFHIWINASLAIFVLTTYYFLDRTAYNAIKTKDVNTIESLSSPYYTAYNQETILELWLAEQNTYSDKLNDNISKGLTYYPRLPEFLELELFRLMNEAKFREALKIANELLEIRSDYNEALAYKAEIYLKLNMNPEVIKNLLLKIQDSVYPLPYEGFSYFIELELVLKRLKNTSSDMEIAKIVNKVSSFASEIDSLEEEFNVLRKNRKRDSSRNRLFRNRVKQLHSKVKKTLEQNVMSISNSQNEDLFFLRAF